MTDNAGEQTRIQLRDISSELYNTAFAGIHLNTDDCEVDVEEAREAAIGLIIMAGFDSGDSDSAGLGVDEVLQSVLMVAMQLCPQLRDRINGTDDTARIVQEEI